MSFVRNRDDLLLARHYLNRVGSKAKLMAKIEKPSAVTNFDEILREVDGIMVARGDLGVEIPIQRIAIVQKELINKANLLGKPAITATHMLESMTYNTRPTRAEATDVANAILDGTDCVMLSGETAVGDYPVETVRVMAKIAREAEPHCSGDKIVDYEQMAGMGGELDTNDLVSMSVYGATQSYDTVAVFTPTLSGHTAPGELGAVRPRSAGGEQSARGPGLADLRFWHRQVRLIQSRRLHQPQTAHG